MSKNEIDVVLCPCRVDHQKGGGSEGETIVVHKEAIVSGQK